MTRIIQYIQNDYQDHQTLPPNLSSEFDAGGSPYRTVMIVATGPIHVAFGRAAAVSDFAIPANTQVFMGVPAGATVNFFTKATGVTVNMCDIVLT